MVVRLYSVQKYTFEVNIAFLHYTIAATTEFLE